jgi:hypothetical protein
MNYIILLYYATTGLVILVLSTGDRHYGGFWSSSRHNCSGSQVETLLQQAGLHATQLTLHVPPGNKHSFIIVKYVLRCWFLQTISFPHLGYKKVVYAMSPWDVAPCCLVEVHQRFSPDDRSCTDLRKVGKLLPVYTVQHLRRQLSSLGAHIKPWVSTFTIAT